VATRIGLFAEMLEHGKHGKLIGVDDHVTLARALEELVVNPDLRARMGAEVKQLRAEMPTWANIAAVTVNLYRELTGTTGNASGAGRSARDPRDPLDPRDHNNSLEGEASA